MRNLRRLVPAVAGLALLASSASCHFPPGTRYVDRVFDDFQTTTNITYRTTTNYLGQPVNLVLDIYQPAGDTATQRPVVMWMHGGCWLTGSNRAPISPYAEDSALRGYVGVNITYRLRNTCSLDAANDALQDALAAVQWLKDHASQYRIDPRAIVVAGHSAGAINAANVLFAPNPSPAAGAVVLSGFAFAGGTAGDPPLIMHQGTTDTTVRPEWAQSTCTSTRNAGNVCDYFSYQDQGHLFPYVEPYATQIKERSAHAIMDRVLIPLGYPVQRMETAA